MMFERLAKRLDSYSSALLLGQTVRRHAIQLWRRDDCRLSEREYEHIARQAAVASLRSEGVDATSYSKVRKWAKQFLQEVNPSVAQKNNSSASHIFAVGEYRLGAQVSNSLNLREFSPAEYSAFGGHFEGETNYNSPPVRFLDHSWHMQLGTVKGRIYKIAPYQQFTDQGTANEVATKTLTFCIEQLGKPTEQRPGFFVWDAADGNVIVQTGQTSEGFFVNLFLTSRSGEELPAEALLAKTETVRARILLVEDEQTIRDALVPTLFAAGFDCREAANGRSAIDLMADGTKIDLVLSNLLLPEVEGWTLFLQVRQHYPSVPFVFMTAIRDPELREAAIKQGAAGFLNKPFNRDEFLRTVREALHHDQNPL